MNEASYFYGRLGKMDSWDVKLDSLADNTFNLDCKSAGKDGFGLLKTSIQSNNI